MRQLLSLGVPGGPIEDCEVSAASGLLRFGGKLQVGAQPEDLGVDWHRMFNMRLFSVDQAGPSSILQGRGLEAFQGLFREP